MAWQSGLYLHEIGHAIGLVHEHQLPDRDQYIYIIYDNVAPSMRIWFNKYSTKDVNQYGVPFEYSSVMHYGVTVSRLCAAVWAVGLLLATLRSSGYAKRISGVDRPRKLFVQPHWETSCTSNMLSVTVYWHQTNWSRHWRLVGYTPRWVHQILSHRSICDSTWASRVRFPFLPLWRRDTLALGNQGSCA